MGTDSELTLSALATARLVPPNLPTVDGYLLSHLMQALSLCACRSRSFGPMTYSKHWTSSRWDGVTEWEQGQSSSILPIWDGVEGKCNTSTGSDILRAQNCEVKRKYSVAKRV